MKIAKAARHALRDVLKGNAAYVLYKIVSRFPPGLLVYDHFHLIRCRQLSPIVLRRLSPDTSLTVTDFSEERLAGVARDIPVDLGVIHFQMKGPGRRDARIIRIDQRGKCIALMCIVAIEEIRSPSGYRLALGKDDPATWVVGTYIDERYRLRGYFAHLASAAFEQCMANGTKNLAGEIHFENAVSLKAHLGIGFVIFREISYFRLLGKAFYWENSGARWKHPRLSKDVS
jgi:L-amino acid N-acyltransferase YncA